MEKKYRVICTRKFQAPFLVNMDDFGAALDTLRDYADKGLFQTFLRPIPGLENLAFIEVWDEQAKEWNIFFADEDGCSHPKLAAEYGLLETE